MKRQFIFIAISLLLAVTGLNSCKKSNDTKPADKPVVLANTLWTGEFNYNDGKAQPMRIAFGESGTLTWAEFKSEYTGSWKLENGLLTISISGTASFTANISSDSALTNIKSTDISGRKLMNAVQTGNDDAVVDGTKWAAPEVSIEFKAGNKLDLFFGASPFPNYTDINYTQKRKAIYFSLFANYDWFLVVSTGAVMKGLNMAPGDPTLYTFFVTKQ
ncbi:MAG TPA: hypothetical protein VK543_16615 [Puia sp.]|nr:hypothetical protein [Puia sp.]